MAGFTVKKVIIRVLIKNNNVELVKFDIDNYSFFSSYEIALDKNFRQQIK